MKKIKYISVVVSIIISLLVFGACNGNIGNISENNQAQNQVVNLVDERFELVALVFRLAGSPGFDGSFTSYHHVLDEKFYDFKEHPAVRFIEQTVRPGFGAAFNLAIHLQRVDDYFVLIENNERLVARNSSWNQHNAVAFVDFLNDFYLDTDFAIFFQEQTDYFMEHSQMFHEKILDQVNFEWFRQHGLEPDNMRVILSPSISNGANGSWVYGDYENEKLIYATAQTFTNYTIERDLQTLIHEFVHIFANPLAEVWLTENMDFLRWSNDSVDLNRMPFYPTVRQMAHEYVTRAYTILYMVENTEMSLQDMLFMEYAWGFRYIQEVYSLITDHEKIEFPTFDLEMLGIEEYYLLEEHSAEMGIGLVRWYFLDLLGHELMLEGLIVNRVGTLGSETGQALYVFVGDSKYLFVDLGCAVDDGWPIGTRQYFVMPIH